MFRTQIFLLERDLLRRFSQFYKRKTSLLLRSLWSDLTVIHPIVNSSPILSLRTNCLAWSDNRIWKSESAIYPSNWWTISDCPIHSNYHSSWFQSTVSPNYFASSPSLSFQATWPLEVTEPRLPLPSIGFFSDLTTPMARGEQSRTLVELEM